jgi:hypothetical protein
LNNTDEGKKICHNVEDIDPMTVCASSGVRVRVRGPHLDPRPDQLRQPREYQGIPSDSLFTYARGRGKISTLSGNCALVFRSLALM